MMRVRFELLCLFLIVAGQCTVTMGQSPQVDDYKLDVAFIPAESRMTGTADVTLTPAGPDSVIFYLHGELDVKGVTWNGDSIGFDQSSVYYRSDYSLVANRILRGARSLAISE